MTSVLTGKTKEASIHDVAFGAGHEVMARVLRGEVGTLFPVVWVGGEDGGLRKYGHSRIYHAWDLAQSLRAFRTGIERGIARGTSVQVQTLEWVGPWPQYELTVPTVFDREVHMWTLWGAHTSTQEHPSGAYARNAELVLQKLLPPDMINGKP